MTRHISRESALRQHLQNYEIFRHTVARATGNS